jgi:putative endonuclease
MVRLIYIEFHLGEYSIKAIDKKTQLSKRSLGNIGEAIAKLVLEKKNYRIIEQNFKSVTGELDIIASTGKTLVFIEVKTRTSDDYGSPSESIGSTKIVKIRKTASWYLAKIDKTDFEDYRFDIIAITVKRNKIRSTSGKINRDGTSICDISEIAEELIDSCTIDHIESAF